MALKLDKENGWLLGVCSGLANATGIKSNVIRLIFVLCSIFAVGTPVLAYLVLWIIMLLNE